MENLSRRSFLALGTLGAASAAAAGLAGCAPQTKGSGAHQQLGHRGEPR